MKRLHLFEFEDLSWFPNLFRKYITDLLEYQITTFKIYNPIVFKIEEVVRKTNSQKIVDLCSGSAGPWAQIYQILLEEYDFNATVLLTDKYPNIEAFQKIAKKSNNQISFIPDSINVTCVPSSLEGFRTFFSAFHHFKPDMAQSILQDAVNKNMPIGIFEFTERSFVNLIKVLFLGVILVWINTPFIRPITWQRLFWTYLIPVIPLVYCWDAFISHLRSYSIEEIENIIINLENNSYEWEIGKLSSKPSNFNITYLIGTKLAK